MAANSKQVHFSIVDEHDQLGIFRKLATDNTEVKCWMKGSPERFLFKVNFFYEQKHSLELIPDVRPKGDFGPQVLLSFDSGGVQYFGSGQLKLGASGRSFILSNFKEFYKCERRKNFRLQVYPVHDCRAYINLKNLEKKNADVVNLKKDEMDRSDKAMREFLKMMGQIHGVDSSSSVMHLRADDISATGLALQLGTMEAGYFEKGKEVGPVTVLFNRKKYEIPNAKVTYIIDYKDPLKPTVKVFKMGLQFLGMSTSLDHELSSHIAKEMRGMDLGKQFEEFIK